MMKRRMMRHALDQTNNKRQSPPRATSMKTTKKSGEDQPDGNPQLSPDHLKRILRDLNYGKESKTTRVIAEFGGHAPR